MPLGTSRKQPGALTVGQALGVNAYVAVSGLDELVEMLKGIEKNLDRSLKRSLRRELTKFVPKFQKFVPHQTGQVKHRPGGPGTPYVSRAGGELRRSLRISTTKKSYRMVTGTRRQNPDVYYASWVAFGHRIPGTGRRTAANPFLRKGMQANREAIADSADKVLQRYFDKYSARQESKAKTARPVVIYLTVKTEK